MRVILYYMYVQAYTPKWRFRHTITITKDLHTYTQSNNRNTDYHSYFTYVQQHVFLQIPATNHFLSFVNVALEFPGIYSLAMPKRCWSEDGLRVYFTSLWRSRQVSWLTGGLIDWWPVSE